MAKDIKSGKWHRIAAASAIERELHGKKDNNVDDDEQKPLNVVEHDKQFS